MAVDIDIRVSPALDPEVVRAVEGFNDETAPYVANVVSAFQDLYVTLGKLHDAAALWRGNPATTPENAILIVGKEAARQKERVSRRLDRAHDDLRANIEKTEGELSRPVQQGAAAGPLAAEVRAHAKSLDRAGRGALLTDALEAGDEATLQAVLGAQPFLSGMTAIDRDHYTHLYHSKNSPHLVARLEVMRSTLDVIYRAGAVIHDQFDKAVGARPQAVQAIDRANERAMAALKIEPGA